MNKEVHSWYSHRIGKTMPVAVYGHSGFPLLMFPTAAADFEEYERFYLIHVMRPWIEAGKVRVFSIDSCNSHTWMNTRLHPGERARKHEFYESYVTKEVVPFIWNYQGWKGGIVTSGASMGAFHAVNVLLKHPDKFEGTIALSGAYDLSPWIGGYMDDTVYYNSPYAYLPGLSDPWYLEQLRAKRYIYILSGSGDYEAPGQSLHLANLLGSKGIPHVCDIWGRDMRHDWTTWRKMMPMVLDRGFN